MNARFYVSGIGRFASADTIVPNPASPQSFNRYSYVLNSPINFNDPSGHCGNEFFDTDCWTEYDALVNQFRDNNYSNETILELIGSGEDYRFKDRSIISTYDAYRNCGSDFDCSDNSPRSYDPYSNPCGWQYWQSCYEPELTSDKILPDAFIIGGSGDTGGFLPSFTVGVEDMLFFEDGDVSAWGYSGEGRGAGASADAGAYAGLVWNLDCVDCYSGVFQMVSIDLGFWVGYEASVFWSPESDTWGISGGPSSGFAASITLYETIYQRLDTP